MRLIAATILLAATACASPELSAGIKISDLELAEPATGPNVGWTFADILTHPREDFRRSVFGIELLNHFERLDLKWTSKGSRVAGKWNRDLDLSESYRSLMEKGVAQINEGTNLPIRINFRSSEVGSDIQVIWINRLVPCPLEGGWQRDHLDAGYAIPIREGTDFWETGLPAIVSDPQNRLVTFKSKFANLQCAQFFQENRLAEGESLVIFTAGWPAGANIEGFVKVNSVGQIQKAYCILNEEWPEKEMSWGVAECLLRSLGIFEPILSCPHGVLGPRIPGQALPNFGGLQLCDLEYLEQLYLMEADVKGN